MQKIQECFPNIASLEYGPIYDSIVILVSKSFLISNRLEITQEGKQYDTIKILKHIHVTTPEKITFLFVVQLSLIPINNILLQ